MRLGIYRIIAIALILLVLGFIIYNRYFDRDVTPDTELLDSLRVEHRRLIHERDSLVLRLNTLFEEHSAEVESLSQSRQQLERRYEERLKELTDITIVSDDSITKYISSRIQDK